MTRPPAANVGARSWAPELFWAIFGVGVALNIVVVFGLGGYEDETGSDVGKLAAVLMVVGVVGALCVRWRRRRGGGGTN